MSLILPPRGIRDIEMYKVDYVNVLGATNFIELEIAQDDNAKMKHSICS